MKSMTSGGCGCNSTSKSTSWSLAWSLQCALWSRLTRPIGPSNFYVSRSHRRKNDDDISLQQHQSWVQITFTASHLPEKFTKLWRSYFAFLFGRLLFAKAVRYEHILIQSRLNTSREIAHCPIFAIKQYQKERRLCVCLNFLHHLYNMREQLVAACQTAHLLDDRLRRI